MYTLLQSKCNQNQKRFQYCNFISILIVFIFSSDSFIESFKYSKNHLFPSVRLSFVCVHDTPNWSVDPYSLNGHDQTIASDISHLIIKSLPTDHEFLHPDPSQSISSSFSSSYSSSSSLPSPNSISNMVSAEEMDASSFGVFFRQCAPYIAMHRNSIAVIHIGSHVFKNRKVFDELIDDISILHLLGVYIVIVAGVRTQLDEKILAAGSHPSYHDGVRISDDQTMKFLKEVSGSARFEVESALARGYRGRPGQSGINVVSGNFFYSAKPFGVRQGVDFKLTGEVRKIEVENIKKRLEFGDVVLLTSLGYSPSGEVFNCQSESLAAECAARLNAAKIIYLTRGEVMYDTRNGKTAVVQNLRLAQAMALLEANGLRRNRIDGTQNIMSFTTREESSEETIEDNAKESRIQDSIDYSQLSSKSGNRNRTDENMNGNMNENMNIDMINVMKRKKTAMEEFLIILSRSVYALNGGVKRAHLITPAQGSLLKELYTRDGSGMLISRDVYEGIRPAQPSDLRSIESIIQPLIAEGILVNRTRDQLEKDLPNTFVLTRDGTTLGLGMLKVYGDFAEIGCLAVDSKYRKGGRGETMLAYLERRALNMNISKVFVLSTHTMQWFEERGFVLSNPKLLPESRYYNTTRASKVYIKHLNSERDIDAEELLWNV